MITEDNVNRRIGEMANEVLAKFRDNNDIVAMPNYKEAIDIFLTISECDSQKIPRNEIDVFVNKNNIAEISCRKIEKNVFYIDRENPTAIYNGYFSEDYSHSWQLLTTGTGSIYEMIKNKNVSQVSQHQVMTAISHKTLGSLNHLALMAGKAYSERRGQTALGDIGRYANLVRMIDFYACGLTRQPFVDSVRHFYNNREISLFRAPLKEWLSLYG